MGIIKPVLPVKLFTGITFRDDADLEAVIGTQLLPAWGLEDLRSGVFEFSTFTSYYQVEMGDNLRKLFVAFEKLIQPDALPAIKHRTNQIEQSLTRTGKRMMNIDPGYLTPAKIVLATTKDYSHRLYLADGIYGDLHLCFSSKSYQAQPWTYPDFKQPLVIEFFNHLRNRFMKQLSGVSIEAGDL